MVNVQALADQVQRLTHILNRHIGPQLAHSQLNSPHPSQVPAGLIAMWSGETVPDGWVLCDGDNGTPDLRNRFLVGSGDEYDIGDTGGDDSLNLTETQLPAHNHSHTLTAAEDEHRHEYSRSAFFLNAGAGSDVLNLRASATFGNTEFDSHSHNITGSIGSTGNGDPVENRPRYYALAYIMKT